MPDNQKSQRGPVMITAGGTGGHVYPGLAVARALQAQDISVVWLGTPNGLEARVIPEADIDMEYLTVSGLRGKGAAALLLAPFQLIKALYQSYRIMKKVKPSAVLGMGGFVAGPGGLVASWMGIPLLIHEQNAIPGLTNKLLKNKSNKVLEGFSGTFGNFKGNRTKGKSTNTIFIGNPVRLDIAQLSHPIERLGNRWGRVNLLIFGGSLGAQALNEVVPMALGEMPLDKRPIVRHQAGKNKELATQNIYEKMGVEATVTPFIEDMAEAYEWADVVICRSGALTVAELAAAGLASIMVPYPYAVDDHQTANARYLSDSEAAVLMPQNDLTKESLSELLDELCGNRDKLIEMAIKARKLSKPMATENVAALCAELAGYDYKHSVDAQNKESITKAYNTNANWETLVVTIEDKKDNKDENGKGGKEVTFEAA